MNLKIHGPAQLTDDLLNVRGADEEGVMGGNNIVKTFQLFKTIVFMEIEIIPKLKLPWQLRNTSCLC